MKKMAGLVNLTKRCSIAKQNNVKRKIKVGDNVKNFQK